MKASIDFHRHRHPNAQTCSMIRNLIFDLSEVLLPGIIGVEHRLSRELDLAPDAVTRAMGSRPHYQVGNRLDQLLDATIDYQQYRQEVLADLGCDHPEGRESFDHACLAMFDEPYPYASDLLAHLAPSYRLFLISDHCEYWVDHITSRHPFFSHFEAMIWSYAIGATKRQVDPFHRLLSRHQLIAEECLFIDDFAGNLATAQALGMQVFHFTGEPALPDLFRRLEAQPMPEAS